ncbi:MAG: 7-carboxy-7-deazaguanine synthase QueE [Pseudonocardiales bacterium]
MTTAPLRTSSRLRIVDPFGTFGPTFQGEGISTGQRALFIRLSRCNLSCPGCDTPETWDWSRYDPHTDSRWACTDELVQWVHGQRFTDLVVITGGEPLLQQHGLVPLVEALAECGRRVEIETNCTRMPVPELIAAVTRFNVSPKLAAFGGGVSRERRIVPEALHVFAASGKAVFKFVACCIADLDEIAELEQEFQLAPVWVMPVGSTHDEVVAGLRALADPVLARGWNLTGRFHVLLWGAERGR